MRNAKSGPSHPRELSWKPVAPEHISSLVPYPPGKPIEETERELGLTGVVKLASNENPVGPSPMATAAVQAKLDQAHRYPDAAHFALKAKLAVQLGVSSEQLMVANGSNEIIDLLMRVFVSTDENVVAPKYSFVAYRLCAQLQGCGYLEASVGDDFSMSVDSILATVNDKTRLVYLANPNNPTGAWLGASEVRRLAEALESRKILLVLDYAYWEYVSDLNIPDAVDVLREYPNVIVLRTFSKIHGLASYRIGYAVADRKVARLLNQARQPFNVNALGLWAAEAALSDTQHVQRARDVNAAGLKKLQNGLSALGVRHFPTQGNFILFETQKPGTELFQALLHKGVIVRPVANYGLPRHVRVSVGLDSENEKFLKQLKEVL